MSIYRSFDTFDPTRTLAPWISRITFNICLKRLQSAGHKAENAADYSEQGDIKDVETRSPEQQAATREVHQACEAVFKTLSASDRALLTLRYREGLSDAEVALAVNMPLNTVKTRIFRARQKLRRQLGPGMKQA